MCKLALTKSLHTGGTAGVWFKAALVTTAFSLLSYAVAAQPARAVDGDTLAIGTERVRIMGLDTPEAGSRARCPREAALARRATGRLAELLASGVTLDRRGPDRYGRTLAVVREARGRDVAEILISERLAVPYQGRSPRQNWCEPSQREYLSGSRSTEACSTGVPTGDSGFSNGNSNCSGRIAPERWRPAKSTSPSSKGRSGHLPATA